MPDLRLEGCRPVPLAAYLKSLGVLRLVSEQVDPAAMGFWEHDAFVLRSKLDRDALSAFFVNDYAPTPVLAPWNGGSGFYPNDNKVGITAIESSTSERMAPMREAIAATRRVLTRLGLVSKPNADEKVELQRACRAFLPDSVLDWLDAAYLLTDAGAKYPPLLGTGGNDGRLEFTNNLHQRLGDLFDTAGVARSAASPQLTASLFNVPADDLESNAVGQFLPGAAGGANATSGFDGRANLNPWDFVLMLEGALLFAAASTRRMTDEGPGLLSYPFCVRPVGSGYTSASLSDEAGRAELWVPIWSAPTSVTELRQVFSEGRMRVGRRAARAATDAARAVATFGVNRGIDAFQRYGFLVRNGLSYFATPLGTFDVREDQHVARLQEIDRWLERFRSKAKADTAPASIRRALRRLDDAIFRLCEAPGPDANLELLVAFGQCERQLARSHRWAEEAFVRAVPSLSLSWVTGLPSTPEWRLARALASTHHPDRRDQAPDTLRRHFEPASWWWHRGKVLHDPDVVAQGGSLPATLNAVFRRRRLHAMHRGATYDDRCTHAARLSDVQAYLRSDTDDALLEELIWAAMLIRWGEDEPRDSGTGNSHPDTLYALLKLCFAGREVRGVQVPMDGAIHELAAAGQGASASARAIRRLRASLLSPAIGDLYREGPDVTRVASALLFPLSPASIARLTEHVLSHDLPDLGETA